MKCVLDANVLYSRYVRDVLLTLAERGLFQPHWTRQILEETHRNLVNNEAVSPEGWAYIVGEMTRYFPDSLVEDFEHLISEQTNSPEDWHVAAAAAAIGASIVTWNLRDFASLPAGVDAISPDDWLMLLFSDSPGEVIDSLTHLAGLFNRPPMGIDGLLDRLETSGCGSFAAAMRKHCAIE